MSQNEPKSAKMSSNDLFGLNRPKLLFTVKNRGFWPKSTKPRIFGQNWPKPVFLVKTPVFFSFWPKSTKTHFFQNRSNPDFLVKTPGFSVKTNQTTIFGHNRPKLVLLVKIDQTPLFFCQKQFFSVKINRNHFFRPKSTKTTFSGQNPVFPARINQTRFYGQNRPNPVFFGQKPVFSVKINENHFFSVKIDPNQSVG